MKNIFKLALLATCIFGISMSAYSQFRPTMPPAPPKPAPMRPPVSVGGFSGQLGNNGMSGMGMGGMGMSGMGMSGMGMSGMGMGGMGICSKAFRYGWSLLCYSYTDWLYAWPARWNEWIWF